MFNPMTGTKPFCFLIFLKIYILVLPVFIRSFDGWGPLRGRRVGVVRATVEEFIEEISWHAAVVTVHDNE